MKEGGGGVKLSMMGRAVSKGVAQGEREEAKGKKMERAVTEEHWHMGTGWRLEEVEVKEIGKGLVKRVGRGGN